MTDLNFLGGRKGTFMVVLDRELMEDVVIEHLRGVTWGRARGSPRDTSSRRRMVDG